MINFSKDSVIDGYFTFFSLEYLGTVGLMCELYSVIVNYIEYAHLMVLCGFISLEGRVEEGWD